MNLPNILTLARIFLVPLLVAALLADGTSVNWDAWIPLSREIFALCVFLAAAATDLLDGYLARRLGQVTTVGTLLDPIADKLLISAALVSLVDIHRVPAWMVILIIGREFAVSGLRSIAAAGGYTIAASDLGKSKMAAQVTAIALVIGSIRWPWLSEPATIGMWAVMLFGIVSAADYFRTFWRRVDDSVKLRRRRELLRLEAEERSAARWRRGSRFKVVRYVALLIGALLSAQDSKVPQPEEYPVGSVFTGTPAAPTFATPGQRRFRTVIRDWAKKGANFAGHYAIAEWGCGTGCEQMVMVDVQSGAVYDGPLAIPEKSVLCLGANVEDIKTGIFYRRNSSLLIVRGCPDFEKCATYYYVWTGTRFKLLRKIEMKEPFGCGGP